MGPTNLPNGNGVEYTLTLTNFGDNSGELVVTLPPNVLKDDAGLWNTAKDIPVGRVDFIEPEPWKVITEGTTYSSIDRTANEVTFKIRGYDKFLDKDSDITKKLDSANKNDYITIYKDDTAVDSAEKANLIKSKTKVEGTPSTTLEYLVVLHNFGSYEGEVSIEVAAETLEDQSDNKNVISPKQGIGNINWVEANDPEGNKYHAFRGNIVDFTKPTITYKYATVEGETNAVVDKEGKKLIVIFDLTEKNYEYGK